MKTALLKDIFREIRASLPRFFSIALMIGLGVFVYTGLKGAAPLMLQMINTFTADTRMADIKIKSSFGLDAQDRFLIMAEKAVKKAEWIYAVELNTRYTDLLLQLQSLPTEMSIPYLTEGRMPEAPTEILLDANIAGAPYKLGDTVFFKKENNKWNFNSDEEKDALKRYRFKVVGFCYHPEFINPEIKGDADGGLGKLNGFAFVLPENFTAENYSFGRMQLTAEQDFTSNDPVYKAYAAQQKEALEALLENRPKVRLTKQRQKVNDAIREGESQLADARKKLKNAEDELSYAERKLREGEEALEAAKANLEQQRAEAAAQLAAAEEKLFLARRELESAETVYKQEESSLKQAEKQLTAGLSEWQRAQAELLAKENLLKESNEQLIAGLAQLDKGIKELALAENNLKQKLLSFGQNPVLFLNKVKEIRKLPNSELLLMEMGEAAMAYAELLRNGEELSARREELLRRQEELHTAMERLQSGKTELERTGKQLNASQAELTAGKAALQQAKARIDSGGSEYESGSWKLEEQRAAFVREMTAADASIAAAEQDLREANRRYQQGKKTWEDKKQEAEEEIADGQEEIDDAKKALKKLKESPYAVLTREDISDYFLYYDSARRIHLLSNIFPVFFFLIALLVCLSTMTRMAEEHRGQIGTLKALGYGNWDISKKYFYYGFFSSLFGGLIGIATGQPILSQVIYQAYDIFVIKNPPTLFFMEYAVYSLLIGILCTGVAAFLVVNGHLHQNATALMRPKAPKSGATILLERIDFVWRRLSFLQKVTARNMFRYKVRMSMTILGIAGCAGLVFLGFALRDSVSRLLPVQYGELTKYDYMAIFDEDFGENGLEGLQALAGDKALFSDHTTVYTEAFTWKGKDTAVQTIYLIVPKTEEDFQRLQKLRSPEDEERQFSLTEDGILLTDKLAHLAKVQAGEFLTIKDTDNNSFRIKIGGICENYLGHYLYMSADAYQRQFGKSPQYNAELLKAEPSLALSEEKLLAKLLDEDAVLSVTALNSLSAAQTLESLDVVVVIIILVSSLLAFVVLYNLTNINISERIRELSTIKVLGFFPQEVTTYVYRETLLLTVLGIGLGYVFGVLLHNLILLFIVPDIFQLYPKRFPLTYVISAVMTFLFSLIVMIFVHFRLKRIDMVEALKSYE